MPVLRVVTKFTGATGSPYYNTLMFTGTGATNAQDAADAARAFWNAFQGTIADTIKADVQSEVEELNVGTGKVEAVHSKTTSQISMAASNTMLPRTTQGLIRVRTGFFVDGREQRGRIFIPCLTEVSNDIGVPSSGIKSTANTAAAALIADADSTWCVYSRANAATATVTGATMWDEWAYLSSRRD